jgi:hypothetical protein
LIFTFHLFIGKEGAHNNNNNNCNNKNKNHLHTYTKIEEKKGQRNGSERRKKVMQKKHFFNEKIKISCKIKKCRKKIFHIVGLKAR